VRVGVLYFEVGDEQASSYVAIVRTAKRLPQDERGSFWIDGPKQSDSGHERRPTAHRDGVCYVAYFYADDRNPSVTPRIFPLTNDQVSLAYRTGGRSHGRSTVTVVRSSQGVGGREQSKLSRRVGCR
jgi:hypothetical protein